MTDLYTSTDLVEVSSRSQERLAAGAAAGSSTVQMQRRVRPLIPHQWQVDIPNHCVMCGDHDDRQEADRLGCINPSIC